MDKQKQIDISKVKSPEIRKRLEICEMENHINSGFDIAYKMQTSNYPNSIAETLYDAGYRKIPEGVVVLTREEHQKYLAFKIIEPQVRGCLDREKKLEKQVRELDKELNLAKSILSYDDERPLEKWAEQVRKETAEKFAERLKDTTLYWTDWGRDEDFARQVDEICKEITGE